MTYSSALDYIHATLKFGSKPGLSRIRLLLHKMGDPQNQLRFIHVAGTNGKGSVCAAASEVLQAAGYKTGLYTSPYITDFCERIQIDGQMIPHEELAEAVERIAPLVDETAHELEQPTEFEIITALAFDYFLRSGCDVVVLEVGLGGRFDATNVIQTPLVSLIASISLDHTEILGDSTAKIAFEKCGIIKEGGVTVTLPGQDPDALETIRQVCAERKNPLLLPKTGEVRILEEGIGGTRILYRGREFFIPLCGRQQIGNFTAVIEAAHALNSRGFSIGEGAVVQGLSRVRLPARMEILKRAPLVLLDGAHNPEAALALANAIDRYLADRRIVTVMGIFADKDYRTVVPLIASRSAVFLAVRPDNPRALPPRITAQTAAPCCPKTEWYEDLHKAYAKALVVAGENDVILICGSFYLAGPMRKIVLGENDSN